jgi:hypothetical protein
LGNTYFIKRDIPPGTHYVISQGESVEPVRMNFEPDRVYYIQEIPRPGVWRARLSVTLTTPEQLMHGFGDCRLLVHSSTDPGENLSEKDYQQAVTDYEREVKEGRHKDYEGYRGVAAK